MSRIDKKSVLNLTIAAMLLAICMVSQIFKNLSVYITGPIINACLIICTMTAGIKYAVLLAIVTPVTAYFIAASPVMTVIPLIIPFIMVGNIVLVVAWYLSSKMIKDWDKQVISVKKAFAAFCSAAVKGLVMGATISLWLLPTFVPGKSPMRAMLPVLQTTFSLTQFITAMIGFVYVFILWKPVMSYMNRINDTK